MSITKLITGVAMGIAAFVMVAADSTPAYAENWTIPVVYRDPPLDLQGRQVPIMHTALDPGEVTKKWNICVSFPTVKGPIYLAYTYGVTEEAKRLGVKMTVYAAQGYGDQVGQIAQVEDCVAQGAEAVVAIAISSDGLCSTIDDLRKKGIVYIDYGIGVNCEVDGRSLNGYYDVGEAIGEYMAKRHPEGSGKIEVLWLPGPPGVSFVEALIQGFKDAIVGSDVDIAKVMYGDIGKAFQLTQVEDGVQTYPGIEYILGTAGSVEVARQHLREIGRQDIGLFSYFITPGVEEFVLNGSVLGTAIESSVNYARISIELAVRILEGKAEHIDITTRHSMLDQAGMKSGEYNRADHLSPKGWTPIFNID